MSARHRFALAALWGCLLAGLWLAPSPSSLGCADWNERVSWGGDLRCSFSEPVQAVRGALGEVSVPDEADNRDGTVFLVAPDVVVTAAHLLMDPKSGEYREPAVVSFPTAFGGREQATVLQVEVGPFDPTARRSRGDWAALKIEEVSGRPLLPMGEACHGALHVIGFTGPALPRESVCKLVQLSTYPYDKRSVIWTSCDATNGMSGGPILEERPDGSVMVIGVLSLELARKPPWSFGPAMTVELREAIEDLSDYPAPDFRVCDTPDPSGTEDAN